MDILIPPRVLNEISGNTTVAYFKLYYVGLFLAANIRVSKRDVRLLGAMYCVVCAVIRHQITSKSVHNVGPELMLPIRCLI